MSWVRVDDRANEHQKQLAAGPLACWLWMCGLMYCNRQKAHDGFIHDAAVSILYPMPNAKRHAEKLVEVGLWDRVDGGGYRIHDYHDYQPTKEQVDEIKAKRAEAGSKGGKQKAARLARARETSDLAESKQTPSNLPDECCDSALAKVCPDPDPDPQIQKDLSATPTGASKPKRRSAKKTKTSLPDDFSVSKAIEDMCAEEGLPDPHEVFPHFQDKCRENDYQKVDWEAFFRNWMRSKITRENYPAQEKPLPIFRASNRDEFMPKPGESAVDCIKRTAGGE